MMKLMDFIIISVVEIRKIKSTTCVSRFRANNKYILQIKIEKYRQYTIKADDIHRYVNIQIDEYIGASIKLLLQLHYSVNHRNQYVILMFLLLCKATQ